MKPPLTWLKMTPCTFSLLLKAFSSLPSFPRGAPCRAIKRLPERILDAFEIDLDGVSTLMSAGRPGAPNSRNATRPSVLAPTSDDREVLLDANHCSFHHRAFLQDCRRLKELLQHLKAKSSREGAEEGCWPRQLIAAGFVNLAALSVELVTLSP